MFGGALSSRVLRIFFAKYVFNTHGVSLLFSNETAVRVNCFSEKRQSCILLRYPLTKTQALVVKVFSLSLSSFFSMAIDLKKFNTLLEI